MTVTNHCGITYCYYDNETVVFCNMDIIFISIILFKHSFIALQPNGLVHTYQSNITLVPVTNMHNYKLAVCLVATCDIWMYIKSKYLYGLREKVKDIITTSWSLNYPHAKVFEIASSVMLKYFIHQLSRNTYAG